MNYDALIIVDMQSALVRAESYNRAVVIENIKALLNTCRKREIPVIHYDGNENQICNNQSEKHERKIEIHLMVQIECKHS